MKVILKQDHNRWKKCIAKKKSLYYKWQAEKDEWQQQENIINSSSWEEILIMKLKWHIYPWEYKKNFVLKRHI